MRVFAFFFSVIIFSFGLNEAFNTNNALYLNKKRKLQAEQLGLPIPKHKCWDHSLRPKPLSIVEEGQEVEQMILHIIEENAESRTIQDGSDPESAKDSNSFIGDSESSVSVYGEAKFETEVSKIWPCDRPSTSSFKWGCNSFKDAQCFPDNATEIRAAGKELTFVERECDPCHHYDGLQVSQNLEEPIPEFEDNLDYSCSAYENENIDPCTDKELDDVLYYNEVKSNIYVLSSGRWSINQGNMVLPCYL